MNDLPPEPTVSVIIPNYETDEYLGQAVDSVCEQTYECVEPIVVDSSGTETARAAASADEVTYLYQEPQGLAAARNRGIEESTGEIVAFLDADDWLTPKSIELRVRAFRERGASFVYGDCQVVKDNEPIEVRTALSVDDPDRHHVHFFLKEGIMVPTVAVRQDELERLDGPFDPSLTAAEDFHCWTRLFAEASRPPVKLDEILAAYRIREESLSHGNRDHFFEEKRRAVNDLTDRYPELATIANRRRALDDYTRARAAFADDDIDECRRHLWRSLHESPSQLEAYTLLLTSLLPCSLLRRWIQGGLEGIYRKI